MPFFRYDQNNSGGSFVEPYVNVIVEAHDAAQADALAEESGLVYFDGCADGRDCDCCGDRWSRAFGDGDPVPSIYGVPLEKCEPDGMWGGLKTVVIYLDGRHEESINAQTPRNRGH